MNEYNHKKHEQIALLDRLTGARDTWTTEVNLRGETGHEAELADATKKLNQINLWIAGIEKEIADHREPEWRHVGRS